MTVCVDIKQKLISLNISNKYKKFRDSHGYYRGTNTSHSA